MNYDLFVKSMLDYIENRVADEITADQVSRAAGFSVPHFRSVFRKLTGEPLARYISHRRLCHAALELARTKKTVSHIAMDYGFSSHDVFIRAFKKAFGETPSEFRHNKRKVCGTLIVPGIFGPTVCEREEKIMNSSIGNMDKNSGTLYGVVPRVSYFNEEIELTPFISCLKACLSYMGQQISYPRLMAGSGAAFRLMWNVKCWDGGNVDIRNMSEDHTEPLRRALAAAGREYRLIFKPGMEGHNASGSASKDMCCIGTGEKNEFLKLIIKEISEGRPLIGFGIIGPPEACIIAGYKNGGETLVGWNFFQEMPEFAAGISKEPCGYYNRNGWYEHPDTIALMAVGDKIISMDERHFLKDTLEFALKVMETPRVNDYAGGFEAYEAWAQALLKESEFPKDAPLPMLAERQMCHCDAITMVGEGRRYAQLFLEQQAEDFPEVRNELKAAAELFKQEHRTIMEMESHTDGNCMGEQQARNLAKPEVRREL